MERKIEKCINILIEHEKEERYKKALEKIFDAYKKNKEADLQDIFNYLSERVGVEVNCDSVDEIIPLLTLYTLDKTYFCDRRVPSEINIYLKKDFLEETFSDIADLTSAIEEEIMEAKTEEEANELADEDFISTVLSGWIDTYDALVQISEKHGTFDAVLFAKFLNDYRVNYGSKNICLFKEKEEVLNMFYEKQNYVTYSDGDTSINKKL